METLSTKVESHMNSITKLCENISNCLSSALELTWESVGTYTGGIISWISNEYVDLIIKHLLMIKYHVREIKKFLSSFSSYEDLRNIFVGLQNTIDTLNEIRIKSWFIQREFSFLIEEIQHDCNCILENFSIYSLTA